MSDRESGADSSGKQTLTEVREELALARLDRAKLARREKQLRALNDMILASLETRTFQDLVQVMADRFAELIDADGCYLTQWDDHQAKTIPTAASGEFRESYPLIEVEPGTRTLTSAVLEEGHTLVIPDARNTEYLGSEYTHQFPARSQIVLPLIEGTHKLGAIIVAFNQPHEFTPDEVAICEQAARNIVLVLSQKHAFDLLSVSETHLTEAQAQAGMGSFEIERGAGRMIWSEGMYRLFDKHPDSAPWSVNEILDHIHPDDRSYLLDVVRKADETADGKLHHVEFRTNPETMTLRHIHALMRSRQKEDGTLLLSGTLQDITERVTLEDQLRHSQKMEAVGRLAGGIAHDFNNLLTIILGSHGLLSLAIEDEETLETLEQSRVAAERAASLTRELLAYSRKQVLQPTLFDIDELLVELKSMLERLVGEQVNIDLTPAGVPAWLRADKSHIERVIVNLAVNAKDAMPEGGTISFSTTLRNADHIATSGSIALPPGEYICLRVTDNGPGIAPEIMSRIFEPFFTTKSSSTGTGLGLATVHGIVEQSGGRISAANQPGGGACFTIYLPRHAAPAQEAAQTGERASNGSHRKTILVAEDQMELRKLVSTTLDMAGYEVLVADDGVTALDIAEHYEEQIDLLLTDVLMPKMNGAELANRFAALCPTAKIIYMSGYADDVLNEFGVAHPANFLAKPFTIQQLNEMLARTLAEPATQVVKR